MVFFQAVDAERDRDIEIRAFSSRIRVTSGMMRLLDLPVRHEVNRFELVVFVEGPAISGRSLRVKGSPPAMIRTGELTAKRLADSRELVGGHLQLLARLVVEFFGEETMHATHVADRRDREYSERPEK